MLNSFIKNWWMLVLRGVLAIILAILAFIYPVAVAATLLFWIGIFVIADGIITLISALVNWSKVEDKWLLLFEAVISIVLGIIILRSPEATALFLVIYLAVWSIFAGITKIATAIQLRKEIEGEGWLILSGIISILFGIILIANPGLGLATIILMLAVFMLVTGILFILLGFKVKKLKGNIKEAVNQIKG